MMDDIGKPRLLVLTTTFPRWPDDDEPPFVHELCRRLTDFEVHVIAPHAPGATTEELMDGVHVHRFRYAPGKLETLAFDGGIIANLKRSRWKYLLLQGFFLSMFFRAIQVARKNDIHLIHAHWMIPTGLLAGALKELLPGDNKMLVTAHGVDLHGLRGKFFQMLRRWVAEEADATTVVSNMLLQIARREQWPNMERVHIAPMGVDVRNIFIPAEDLREKQLLVFFGRLVEKKGPQHLVEAMRTVVGHYPSCKLVIAGDGPLRDPLETRIRELGLEHDIQFTGRYVLKELPHLVQRATLAVLPFDVASDGDTEGLGLTIIEAMGCGTPVIVGDVQAVHDVVEDGRNAILVESANPSSLAESIIALLQDPQRRTQLAEQARADCLAHFDWEPAIAHYASLLGEMHESTSPDSAP